MKNIAAHRRTANRITRHSIELVGGAEQSFPPDERKTVRVPHVSGRMLALASRIERLATAARARLLSLPDDDVASQLVADLESIQALAAQVIS